MYDTFERDFYRRHMLDAFCATVSGCEYCTRMSGIQHKNQSNPILFPTTGTLELVVMDILGQLPNTKDGFQYVVLITNR